MRTLIIILLILYTLPSGAQNEALKIGLLKYNGGGDWYSDPTALPNLIDYCNTHTGTHIYPEPTTIEVGSPEIFNVPFVHLTGHGNIIFSESEAHNLRIYLEGGGFLHTDDNYGLDEYFRREMKKVFPEYDFVELPPSHSIFHQIFDFNEGLPKIHEHDNKPPQAFGLFIEDRMVCLYTYEADLSDGWEDPGVHNDPESLREKALQMGANIISYVFQQ